MIATWYVMEDGSVADPSDISPTPEGKLKHKDGRLVAMRGEVPSTRGVHAEDREKYSNREMKPAPKRTYKNRELKAD
jgi:hypothetical protein